MMSLAIGVGILFSQAESEQGLRALIDQLGSERVEVRDEAARKLIDSGDSARAAVEDLAAHGDLEGRSRAKEVLKRIDARRAVRGRKVLVSFHAYPVGSMEKGADNTDAHDKAARDIQEALGKAGVKVLQILSDTRQSERRYENPKAGAVHFEQMILVDCQGREPEEVLAGLPYRRGAIVFEDGRYARGLGDTWKQSGGAPPARYAFMSWGSFDQKLKEADLARYRNQRGVALEETPVAPRLAGNGGSVELTPEPGVTLLEVFLLTRAKFSYAKED